jgi:hypothetical protein
VVTPKAIATEQNKGAPKIKDNETRRFK